MRKLVKWGVRVNLSHDVIGDKMGKISCYHSKMVKFLFCLCWLIIVYFYLFDIVSGFSDWLWIVS